ncbi:MAG: hypothetical protein HY835_10430 [Anaerolineae bacterium]|nr:hypothetical protein [Anaerolineae bacterium]
MGKKSLMALMFLSMVFGCTGCTEKTATKNKDLVLSTNVEMDKTEQDNLKKVVREFMDVCRPLQDKYIGDIEKLEFIGKYTCGKDSFDYRCESHKWSTMVYLKLKIKEDATTIPSSLRAWGHTEHIYIGGPSNPGFTISKFPQLCGSQPSNDGDVFLPAPGMAQFF